ncbi:MAG: hypothetical protein PWQ12_1530 [Clostridiales bacterium]|jgi:Fe-S cluster assembly iron-binding protein IscA|nr:hypothetical protein [Clostridiales bacterium]
MEIIISDETVERIRELLGKREDGPWDVRVYISSFG